MTDSSSSLYIPGPPSLDQSIFTASNNLVFDENNTDLLNIDLYSSIPANQLIIEPQCKNGFNTQDLNFLALENVINTQCDDYCTPMQNNLTMIDPTQINDSDRWCRYEMIDNSVIDLDSNSYLKYDTHTNKFEYSTSYVMAENCDNIEKSVNSPGKFFY